MKKMILSVFVLLIIPFLVNAQSDVHKMLKDIKGTVDEIIIKSDGKEYTFSGDEASKLFSAIKEDNKMKRFEFYTDDGKIIRGDSLNEIFIVKKHGDHFKSEGENGKKAKKIKIFIDGDDEEGLVWTDENGESEVLDIDEEVEFFVDDQDDDGIQKRIEVEIKNDSKTVTVITNKDGKENIEVYEGNAADEYLEKMKSDKEVKVKVDVDKNSSKKKIKKIIIDKQQ